jgi:hypothetical protein
MLVFIIPLKSPQVAKSWEHVSRLFERTVKSVCRQTSPDFRVIVVCNEKPHIEFKHPYITYFEVDFPIPEPKLTARAEDKIRKISAGLIYAREFKPTHTMVVDADDCVSKHLAKFVNQNPKSNGWFLSRGYLYPNGSQFVYLKRQDFHQWCGTCSIIRYDLQGLPERTQYDCPDIKNLHCPHPWVVDQMIRQGTPIEPLPFAGAIYIVCHGDQDRNFENTIRPKEILPRLKKLLLNYRFLTRGICEEFGLYNI